MHWVNRAVITIMFSGWASAINAQPPAAPILAVGCLPKDKLQPFIFNAEDRRLQQELRLATGKIAIRDQFYSSNPAGLGPMIPVRTSIGVDYDGKSYGTWGYIIEADISGPVACVRRVFRADRLLGESHVPQLRVQGAEVVAEGADKEDPAAIVTILMRTNGGGGNTFLTRQGAAPIALRSHGRDRPSSAIFPLPSVR